MVIAAAQIKKLVHWQSSGGGGKVGVLERRENLLSHCQLTKMACDCFHVCDSSRTPLQGNVAEAKFAGATCTRELRCAICAHVDVAAVVEFEFSWVCDCELIS